MNLQLSQFEAVWFRSKIKLMDGAMSVVPPIKYYNPFESYVPFGQAKARGDKALVYEFANLNVSDSRAIIAFSEKYGLLGISESIEMTGFEEVLIGGQGLSRSRQGTLGAAFHGRYGSKPFDQVWFTPLTLEEFRVRHEDLSRTLQLAEQLKRTQDPKKFGQRRDSLCYAINSKLQGRIYPRLIWNPVEERLVLGWHVSSLESALYMMLLFDINGPARVVGCMKCRSFFLAPRNETKFCSRECLNAYKQAQYRKRQLPELTKQKGGRSNGHP